MWKAGPQEMGHYRDVCFILCTDILSICESLVLIEKVGDHDSDVLMGTSGGEYLRATVEAKTILR